MAVATARMTPTTLISAARKSPAAARMRGDLAYHVLRGKILRLEIAPAALINEAELMATLEVGRTPLREALQRLCRENLVVILPRRGTLVADLNLSDLQKVSEMRRELEPFAARLAAERATPAQIAAMQQNLRDTDALDGAGDYRQLIELDARAHALLAEAAHNEFLSELLERMYNQVLRLWYVGLHRVGRLPEAIAEHHELVSAIAAHDADAAQAVMRRHVAGFEKEFLKVV